MPVRYIGRESLQKGKSLYEICRQLANSGVGRVVYRQRHADYWPDQKSFFRLTKVVPDKTSMDCRKGEAWGNRVFRGAHFGECRIGSGHKDDWKLVPKQMEEQFCKITDIWAAPPQPPSHITAPPWLNILLNKQNQSAVGDSNAKPLKIPLCRLVKVPARIEEES